MESTLHAGDVRPRRLRAFVFSNFPKDYFKEILQPKLEQINVEILKIANIDRSPNIEVNPEADIIIALVELMSNGQKKAVKEVARRCSKKFVAIQRKSAEWPKILAPIFADLEEPPTPSVSLRAVPPASKSWEPRVVPPPPPTPLPEPEPEVEEEPNVEELQSYLKLFETENQKLEKKLEEAEVTVQNLLEAQKGLVQPDFYGHQKVIEQTKKERDQLAAELQKLKKAQGEEGEKILRLAKLNIVYEDRNENLEKEVKRLRKEAKDGDSNDVLNLQGRLNEAQKYVENAKREVANSRALSATLDQSKANLLETEALAKKQAEELYTLKKENEQLRKNPQLFVDDAVTKKLREENELLKKKATMKTTEDFLKLREALATVWRLGAMTDRDVLDKLMNWQPKEA